MKKTLIFLTILTMSAFLLACGGEKKTVHCDECGTEIEVNADSNVTEDWTLLCEDCGGELDQQIADEISGK